MKVQKMSVVTLLAVFCCILWGSAFPGIKIGYEWLNIRGAGSQILFAGWRFFLAGAMTFIIFSIKDKKLLRIKKSSIPAIIGQGFLQTSVQYFFFYIGLAHTTGARGSVITASNAFFSIITAHFIMKERLDRRKVLGCIIGFLGVIIVNMTPGTFESAFTLKGEGFVLICAVAYGVSTVTTKLISGYEKPESITAYQLMIGGGILVAMGYAVGGEIGRFDLKSGILFFYLAFLSTIAFTIWAVLLKSNPVGRVAPFGFTIPIFGTLLSGIFLHESIFTVNNLLALVLVCGGILWVNTEKRNIRRESNVVR